MGLIGDIKKKNPEAAKLAQKFLESPCCDEDEDAGKGKKKKK